MRIISFAFLLLIMLFGITFAALNSTPVMFNYYLGAKQLPLSLLLVFIFGIGILTGFIFLLFPILRLKSENIRLKSRLKIADQEIANLRTIPLKGE
jgi:lipopolysaccharide assembly protein A